MLYHLGNITIDTNSFAVLHEGSPVHSEPLTFDLICYLIERRDRVVTRHELLKALWPNQYVTDGSVSNEIKEARKCLADSGKKQHVIKTHHGRGYQFIAEVTEISSFQPPPTNEPRTDNHLITPLPTALALSLEQHRFSTIPYPITRFVGRKIELEYLAEKLLNYPDDILSIVGPGGVGKTRLAIALAQIHKSEFKAGVYYLDCDDIPNITILIQKLATLMIVPEYVTSGHNAPDSIKALSAFLGDRKQLVVLDNFEHLIAHIAVIASLATQTTQTKILITSRIRPNIANEHCFKLDGMKHAVNTVNWQSTNQQDALITPSDATALFIDRAKSSLPEPKMAILDDTATIAKITELLEGYPLEIEIVASWLRIMTLPELLRTLTDDALSLETDSDLVINRHQRLQQLFKTAINTLPKPLQMAFFQMCYFEPDFSRQAAMAVTGVSLMDLLTLERNSLIKLVKLGRFRIHELLRQYGTEKLVQCDKVTSTKDAMAKFIVARCKDAIRVLEGTRTPETEELIRADASNFKQTLDYLLSQGRYEGTFYIIKVFHLSGSPQITAQALIYNHLPQFYDQIEPLHHLEILDILLRHWNCAQQFDHAFLETATEMQFLAHRQEHKGFEGVAIGYLADYFAFYDQRSPEVQILATESCLLLRHYVDQYAGEKNTQYVKFCFDAGDMASRFNDTEVTMYYYKRAFTQAKLMKNNWLVNCGHWGLTLAYLRTKQPHKALIHCQQALKESLEYDRIFTLTLTPRGIAGIAQLLGHFDIAAQMLGRTLHGQQRYWQKSFSMTDFANVDDIAELKGKLGENRFLELRDSVKDETFSDMLAAMNDYISANL